jgi:hypothetical protein
VRQVELARLQLVAAVALRAPGRRGAQRRELETLAAQALRARPGQARLVPLDPKLAAAQLAAAVLPRAQVALPACRPRALRRCTRISARATART